MTFRSFRPQKLNTVRKTIWRLAEIWLNGLPASATDFPNNGELRLPIGVARLTWLSALLANTSNLIVYSGCQAFLKKPLPLLFDLSAEISLLPKAIAFIKRKLSVNRAGPVPRFGGIIVCPGSGAVSNAPKRVFTTVGRDRSVANAGLSLKMESPFKS